MRGLRFMLPFALAVLVVGCATTNHPTASSSPSGAQAQVDTVHIVRLSDVPQSQLPPFDYTGRDAVAVQALYTRLFALPPYTANGTPCPPDSGVQYQLTFSHRTSVALNAIADPSGCQVVVINGRDNRRAANSNLWALLAAAVGVPAADVYPLPTH